MTKTKEKNNFRCGNVCPSVFSGDYQRDSSVSETEKAVEASELIFFKLFGGKGKEKKRAHRK